MNEWGPGQLLFAFVRHWSRRTVIGGAGLAEQGRLIQVTEAVNTLIAHAQPATVNAVAEEIGIDQSGASRMIKSAVDAGYLIMTRGSVDSRRREVSVTAAGAEALEQAHAWQEEMFAELTAGWSRRRREEFRSAMADLITQSYAKSTPHPRRSASPSSHAPASHAYVRWSN